MLASSPDSEEKKKKKQEPETCFDNLHRQHFYVHNYQPQGIRKIQISTDAKYVTNCLLFFAIT